MKTYKLKKKPIFSLIVIVLCFAMVCSVNYVYDITGLIYNKVELIKEKEMKHMFGEVGVISDNYSYENTAGYVVNNNIINQQDAMKLFENNANSNTVGYQFYLPQKNKNNTTVQPISDYIDKYKEYQSISNELKTQVEEDSYRHKKLGFYYIFNYEYTMDALKKLDSVIEETAKAQKMPKALLTSVLFREMMFMGQEDLLDGVKVIGGKSMGICQIGIQNARYNENTVHGKESVISSKSDDEIAEMLQNPNQAVYFCAVQLRARAITLTGNKNVRIYDLNEKQIQKVLAEYNQSYIPKTIGPVKTKERYGVETYKYYQIISRLYEFQSKNENLN